MLFNLFQTQILVKSQINLTYILIRLSRLVAIAALLLFSFSLQICSQFGLEVRILGQTLLYFADNLLHDLTCLIKRRSC